MNEIKVEQAEDEGDSKGRESTQMSGTEQDTGFKQYRTVFIQVPYIFWKNKHKETCRQR